MPLVEELPPSVESALKMQRNGSGDLPLTIAIKADLAPDGKLGERWVVADEKDIRVLGPEGEPQLLLPLAQLNGFQTEQLVGGGALFAQRGTDRIELTRFTTPLAGNMAGVARALDAVSKGNPLPEAALDDIEKKCPKCGRALPKDSEVCRFCFDKRATFFRLLSYAAPYRWHALFLTVLMFTGTAAGLAPGYIIKLLTDEALAPIRPHTPESRYYSLGVWVGGLILASLLGLGLGIFRGRLAVNAVK